MRGTDLGRGSQAAEPFAQGVAVRGFEHERLRVFIGRWINEGYTLDDRRQKALPIQTADVYDWMPGRFFVLHTAYGRIGDLAVRGTEILGYDAAVGEYVSWLYDSSGGCHRASLRNQGETWTWRGAVAGCTADFTEGGRVQTAHHVRRNPDGLWVPAMEVVLRKIA